MIVETLLFFLGLTILYYGAEFLVKGSANTAVILGANPIVVGLTIVAFGTSAPELVACLIAVYSDATDLAVGNVIGSNIANIGLVMGIGAIIFPITIQKRTLARDLPIMLFFTLLFVGFSLTGEISRVHGAILFAGILATTGYYVWGALKHKTDTSVVEGELEEIIEEDRKLSYELWSTAGGLVGVVVGAYLLVESATAIARALGVSDLVIGVTIVAIGTSLPELATTAVAALRKHSDIVVGAILGSNIYNIGLIMGVTAMAKPVEVARETVTGEMVIMTLFSLALIPVAFRASMGRSAGIVLLISYALFIWWSAIYKGSP